MMTTSDKQLQHALNDIEELQTKVAFQEHTIDELNDALAGQQKQIDTLQVQLRHMFDKVKSLSPSNVAKMSEETPPPHY